MRYPGLSERKCGLLGGFCGVEDFRRFLRLVAEDMAQFGDQGRKTMALIIDE